jgi:anti-anti-sigma regulatory factor
MGISLTESSAGNLVTLDGSIEISSAAELKTLLLQALSSGKDTSVSLGEATYLDVTAVQLLWAARQQAQRSGVGFEFSSPPSELVSNALADAGFPSFSASAIAG